jgi:hypothetical protein
MTIRSRLPTSLSKFLTIESLTDCYLVSPIKRYPCHRVVLASQSKWFSQYFDSHTDPLPISVPTPIDDSIISTILDFFYTSTVTCTLTNLPLLLKAATVCDIPKLKEIVSHSLANCVNPETVLGLSRDFVSLDLLDEACQFASVLAEHYDPHSVSSLKTLSTYICPKIFAKILAEEKFAHLTFQERVSEIDRLVGKQDLIDLEACKAFENQITWNSESYKLLTQFHCGWISPKRFRELGSQLLNARRSTIHNFEKVRDFDLKRVNRWFTFAWLTEISNGIVTEMPEVRMVDFISTFGRMIPPINPHLYGMVTVRGSPAFSKPYKLELVLESQQKDGQIDYYLSEDFTEKSDDPYIEIDFRNAPLLLKKVELDCAIDHELATRLPNPKVSRMKNRRMVPKSVMFECGLDRKSELVLKDGQIESSLESVARTTITRFTMIGEALNGGRLFRVRKIDFVGNFLPE